MAERLLDLGEIERAAQRLVGMVLRTPLVAMGTPPVLLKAENLQPGGSFKLRGALNTLLELDPGQLRRGVVAHSSGNHAIAVALASTMVGTRATVVMPNDAPRKKLDTAAALGAQVVVVGPDSSERAARASAIASAEGRTIIEPYDSFDVLAATATIGREIVEDTPETDLTVFVPISGGGLAGGVATAVKLARPDARVVGVEPELAADALASWRAGERVELPADEMSRTCADGLRVRVVGELTWPHLRTHLDDIITVSEAEIHDAMRRIALEARLVAEPSGAVAAAGAQKWPTEGVDTVAAVVSGGNVDASMLQRVFA